MKIVRKAFTNKHGKAWQTLASVNVRVNLAIPANLFV